MLLYVDPFLQNKLCPIRYAINIKGTLKEGLWDKIVVTSVSIGFPVNDDTVATGLIQRAKNETPRSKEAPFPSGENRRLMYIWTSVQNAISKPYTIEPYTLCGENNDQYSDIGLQFPVIP